ncbi:hypothetical protein QBC38DRAFT_515436 [Podospora fimiseda]|uniref:Secreted protein n=1 Tax=Podospora fimiseda TaxID=252190 RepID=A0AAN7BIW3_9PEZI|nr:hypothetical protein QBC38DRAFT_515436 [Podospora fimiseda]
MLSTTFFTGAILAAIASFTNQAIATPTDVDKPVFASSIDQGHGIQWTGVIFPGGPEVELWGYADEIYAQVLAINPDYVPQPFNETVNTNDGETTLAKRSTITCAPMDTGDRRELKKQSDFLYKLGGHCATPKNECRRTACGGTSGTYLCDESPNPSGTRIPCHEVGLRSADISNACCKNTNRKGQTGNWFGQKTYSVWIGYANCNAPSETYPSNYPYGGGSPNGLCWTWS